MNEYKLERSYCGKAASQYRAPKDEINIFVEVSAITSRRELKSMLLWDLRNGWNGGTENLVALENAIHEYFKDLNPNYTHFHNLSSPYLGDVIHNGHKKAWGNHIYICVYRFTQIS